jgi:putative sterol carrier protein
MPHHVLNILESLKLYLNLPGCVYFLGVDRHALGIGIQHHYKDLALNETSYLDKIIQLPFTIPPIAPESMEGFVTSLLPDALKPCQALLVSGLGDNPRQVKRFINTLTLNHQLASRLNIFNYDPTVLAMMLIIQYRSPALYHLIAAQPHLLLKLKMGAGEAKTLSEEYVARDGQLKKAIEAAEIPLTVGLEPYIYLTRAAGVREKAEESIGGPSVRETFDLMASRFQPGRGKGVIGVVQYVIEGEGGGTWYASIKDGTCTVTEGIIPNPNLIFTMAAQDWLDLLGGKLSGQMAFMSGKLKLKGDMGLAMKVAGMFGTT